MNFLSRFLVLVPLLPLACTPTAPAPRGGPASAVRPRAAATTTAAVGVFIDRHPTPTLNPQEQAHLKQLAPYGFSPAFCIGVADYNRFYVWHDDAGRVLAPDKMDWNRSRQNMADPPTEIPTKGLTRQAAGMPVFVDIEGTRVLNFEGLKDAAGNPREPNKAERENAVRAMTQTIRWAREVAGEGGEVYWFYYPQFNFGDDIQPLQQDLADRLSGAAFELYNWNESALSGTDSWYRGVRLSEERAAKMGMARKVAFVTPWWNILDNGTADYQKIKHLAGKPLPMVIWKRQVNHLVDGGWDLFLFTGWQDVKDVDEHLKYLKSVAK